MNNSVLEKTLKYVTKNTDSKHIKSEAKRNQLQNLTVIRFFFRKYTSLRNEKKKKNKQAKIHTNIHK